jgi:diaminopimelate epimerase
MTRLRFVKMHGAGNDYVYVLGLEGPPLPDGAALAPRVADRRRGIGSDGLVYVERSPRADARMRMWNADGSEGEMCGNAIRCVAKLLVDRGLAGDALTIDTLAGPKKVQVQRGTDGRVTRARVDMGPPALEGSREIAVAEERVQGTCVSMGNPHFVLLDEDLSDARFAKLGPAIERHEAFPRRTNVEFVKVEGRNRLSVRVFERGSGETLSCGTGACAALVAARAAGRADERATVALRGGTLAVEFLGEGASVFLEGPAVEVFQGEIEV